MMAASIRSLRQRLGGARRAGGRQMLGDIVEGLHDLADAHYRCCLVDFESCRPAFYVRVLGFERSRVKVELEFPIEPRLCPVQWLPLSHLADYDEVQHGDGIHRIYEEVSPYVRSRTTTLQRRTGVGNGRHRGRVRALGQARCRPRQRRRYGSVFQVLWWGVALLLLSMSVAVFVTA